MVTPHAPEETAEPRAGALDPAGASFADRHIGPSAAEREHMLQALGLRDLDELVARTVPSKIRLRRSLALDTSATEGSEHRALAHLRRLADRNRAVRSYLGTGYAGCITPPVLQRNLLENPGWYTAYTPYQAEIAQGRLEALLNFQTLITDLTGLPVANASLLDEATAVAEAMALCHAAHREQRPRFVVAAECHPQTIAVVETRAWPLGIEIVHATTADLIAGRTPLDGACGVVIQSPATDGAVFDYRELAVHAHDRGGLLVVAADPLSLLLLEAPGVFGADVVVGSTQRFGMPIGCGGPHAAFFATTEATKRLLPGRIVGVSKDRRGQPALRLALQTREQHIRRERATSNICTAQVLPAVMASMYAVYHGPDGLGAIAGRVHRLAGALAAAVERGPRRAVHQHFFDTVRLSLGGAAEEARVLARARAAAVNLRAFGDGTIAVTLDETTSAEDVAELVTILTGRTVAIQDLAIPEAASHIPAALDRKTAVLTHPVFHRHRSETEMMRYLKRLESKDLSLTTSMIPLGSCTMKLNAAAEMMPVTWPGFAGVHPFAPAEQTQGYAALAADLERWLAEITGFAAVSLQPNAGSQGEFAGLLAIRRYHQARGEGGRLSCLIPTSAHGTNPASASMAGLRVVAVACDDSGNVDLADLERKAAEHGERLAALMVTYPSTHGVFEEAISEICAIVHRHGGQVYMDGANLNAQVGLCRPGDLGADVCHLNLHKTFCIPHGGGGPGMGPIGVAAHLVPHLPGHPHTGVSAESLGVISAAPLGSGAILPISWAYIAMMGPHGLKLASQVAILSANYLAHRLEPFYPVLYRGRRGMVAHECILDLRPLKRAGVEVEDVAKRLMDYGFHAPTVSFPVAGTLMIEPTESESLHWLDRFCDALIAIREETAQVERGELALEQSPLRRAPHTARGLLAADWNLPYTREQAAYPLPYLHEHKYWPPVERIDNAWGDRNLVCTCAGMEAYAGDGGG